MGRPAYTVPLKTQRYSSESQPERLFSPVGEVNRGDSIVFRLFVSD